MKNKKMIVVDLDGTLLNINQECSRKTKKYLNKLKELGYIIVIATGRVLRSAIEITDGATFANYVIANSGGVIYDMDKAKVIKRNSISKNDIRKICSYYNDDVKHIELGDLFYYNKYIYDGVFKSKFDKKIDNIDRLISILPSSEIVKKHHDFIFDTLINNPNNDVNNISSQLKYVFNNRDGWGRSDAEIEACDIHSPHHLPGDHHVN